MKAFDITFIGAVIALIACFIPLWLGPNQITFSNLLKVIATIIVVLIILIIIKFYYGFESDIFNFSPQKPVDNIETNNTSINQSEEIEVKITSIDQFNFSRNNEKALPDYVKNILGPGITKGFFGTFDYSRELTEEEKNNWSSDGNLYDNDGNIIEYDGGAPNFYTDLDGHFAVGLHESTESGKYTFALILHMGKYSDAEHIDISID